MDKPVGAILEERVQGIKEDLVKVMDGMYSKSSNGYVTTYEDLNYWYGELRKVYLKLDGLR